MFRDAGGDARDTRRLENVGQFGVHEYGGETNAGYDQLADVLFVDLLDVVVVLLHAGLLL